MPSDAIAYRLFFGIFFSTGIPTSSYFSVASMRGWKARWPDLSGKYARMGDGRFGAPLVADLFLFCYERDFMLSLSEENQSGIIEAFNSTSRYLDDLLNIDNNFFDSMVNRIYPSELQLNKANVSDAEASFLDLHLYISDGFVKTKIYDKRDDFDFDIVNFPFLDGDVPRSAS